MYIVAFIEPGYPAIQISEIRNEQELFDFVCSDLLDFEPSGQIPLEALIDYLEDNIDMADYAVSFTIYDLSTHDVLFNGFE